MKPPAGEGAVLVTGATGFVGSRLARRLVRDGREVHALVRPGSDLGELAPVRERLRVHVHDGSSEGLGAIVAAARPALVFHLASLFVAEHAPWQVEPLVRSNLLLLAQLADAMAAEGVQRLVNTGTDWQHFERAAYRPVNLYAATKQAAEALLDYYVDAAGLRVITLKLSNTYGPDDPRGKLFSLLQHAAASGAPLEMSPGNQRVDMVYIEDVVEAFLLSARRLEQGRVRGHARYSVATREPMTLRELVARFKRIDGRPLDIRWGARPHRAREVMIPWRTGRRLPGWRPRVDLATGIRRLLGKGDPERPARKSGR
jgi:nucleoside-diphosphate-sugar epimerase